MKIVKVIHGYPMRYNAGSEVYSQTLCHGLASHHDVHVFTREEDAFAPDFRLRQEQDTDDSSISVHIVNNPRLKDSYRIKEIDLRFGEVLDMVNPDIVHVGHLNHLSTSLLKQAKSREIPIVFTLHDYWLMCPRGQFMQMFPEDPDNLWAACDGQEDLKCAERCYTRYFSGAQADYETDIGYWTDWVERRMSHVRKMTDLVDLFIAPARYLRDRFQNDFGLPENKLVYLDYGFARERMTDRRRIASEPFTFGYIGTHIPAKGVHQLIQAFGSITGDVRLRVWGRPRGEDTESLRSIATSLGPDIANRIEWLSEYKNQEIVRDVFDRCDAIVVPSVWVENSPLVIHEAQQARVPVVTADAGGMAEYVHHEVNGLLFKHRSVDAMAEQMQRLVDSPAFAKKLGNHGYLYSDSGDIPAVSEHVREVEQLYERVLSRKSSARLPQKPGPWRITFDTNPDTCNLHCIMCEEHSPLSSLQETRKTAGLQHRIMPFEIIERVISEAVEHGLQEIIPSTMGEPLLYKHFDKIIDLCHRYDIRLNLTTNGTFPGRGAKVWAKLIVPVTSDVKISWNGAARETQETIMLDSRWDESLQNLRDFIAVRDAHAAAGGKRCRATLQLTFLESNVNELADMVKLAIELGIDRVKGHHLWTHFDEIRDQSMRRNPAAIERWNQAVKKAQAVAAEQPLQNGQHIQLDNIFPLEDNATQNIAPDGLCPFLGQEAWVSASGRFDPCCAPDAQRRTLGEFGNLNDTSLMDIWTSENYRKLISTYRNRRLCQTCNMRKPAGTT